MSFLSGRLKLSRISKLFGATAILVLVVFFVVGFISTRDCVGQFFCGIEFTFLLVGLIPGLIVINMIGLIFGVIAFYREQEKKSAKIALVLNIAPYVVWLLIFISGL